MGPEREEELWKSAEIRNLSSCQNHSEWGIFEDKNDLFAKNIDIFPVISNLNPVHLWLSAKNQHRIPQDPKLYDSNFLLRLFYNLLQPGSEVVLFSFVIFVYLFFFHLSSENLKIFVYLIFFYFWKKARFQVSCELFAKTNCLAFVFTCCSSPHSTTRVLAYYCLQRYLGLITTLQASPIDIRY